MCLLVSLFNHYSFLMPGFSLCRLVTMGQIRQISCITHVAMGHICHIHPATCLLLWAIFAVFIVSMLVTMGHIGNVHSRTYLLLWAMFGNVHSGTYLLLWAMFVMYIVEHTCYYGPCLSCTSYNILVTMGHVCHVHPTTCMRRLSTGARLQWLLQGDRA